MIDQLTKDIKPNNESTKYGVGDDCAVLHYPASEVLITTDMLMEGVHFDLTYIDLQHLGYKSAMVNISDIFAMNGTPRQMTVSLALSKRFSVEDMEMFYSGLRMACDKWGIDIVGGDTTSWVQRIWDCSCWRERRAYFTRWWMKLRRKGSLHPTSNLTLLARNICCNAS